MSRAFHPRLAARSHALGAAAQSLLARLVEDGPVPSDARHARDLTERDLARIDADGSLAATDAGRAHMARLRAARTGQIDPFRAQHLDLVRRSLGAADDGGEVTMDAAESPLLWLARRKGRDGRPLVDPVQLMAGERLRADVTRAQMMPRVTADWSAAIRRERGGGPGGHFSDAALAARQRVRNALGEVGHELAGLLIDVCCFLKRLDDVERERRWPPRSAKVVLQVGLDSLARHYGYETKARGPAATELRLWVDDTGSAGR